MFSGKEDDNSEDALTPEIIEKISKHAGKMWKRLAMELNTPEDDIAYFESENHSDQSRSLKMLTVWAVSSQFSYS